MEGAWPTYDAICVFRTSKSDSCLDNRPVQFCTLKVSIKYMDVRACIVDTFVHCMLVLTKIGVDGGQWVKKPRSGNRSVFRAGSRKKIGIRNATYLGDYLPTIMQKECNMPIQLFLSSSSYSF